MERKKKKNERFWQRVEYPLAAGSKIRWPILSRLTCISRLPFRFYDLTPARGVPFLLLLFETLYVGLDGFWFSFG